MPSRLQFHLDQTILCLASEECNQRDKFVLSTDVLSDAKPIRYAVTYVAIVG